MDAPFVLIGSNWYNLDDVRMIRVLENRSIEVHWRGALGDVDRFEGADATKFLTAIGDKRRPVNYDVPDIVEPREPPEGFEFQFEEE